MGIHFLKCLLTLLPLKCVLPLLSLNKSPGRDNIRAEFIRFAHPSICIYLSVFFDLCTVHSFIPSQQARSQDLEKGGGGFFESVAKLQRTLTRIFIILESVSHGLSEI